MYFNQEGVRKVFADFIGECICTRSGNKDNFHITRIKGQVPRFKILKN